MKASCIGHPQGEPLIIIRNWQIRFCEGNKCAAALLSFFEYWHNIKSEISQKNKVANDIQEKHGDLRTQDETLVQFHTEKQLTEGVLGLFGREKISHSISFLQEKGVVKVINNPNPRYKFDRTRHFLFNPLILNDWLADYRFSDDRQSKNRRRSSENSSRSSENRRAIPETTTEITTEISQSVPEDTVMNKKKEIEQTDLSACSHRQDGRTDIFQVKIKETGATKKQLARAWQRLEEQKEAGTVIRHEEKYFLATLENEIEKDKLRKPEGKSPTLDEIFLDCSASTSDKASSYISQARDRLMGKASSGGQTLTSPDAGDRNTCLRATHRQAEKHREQQDGNYR